MTVRFEKKMKRQADTQARETVWKNTLRERFGYSMERQTDQHACRNEGQIEKQACEQDGRTYLERGLGRGWMDYLRDRLS
jgi:hypothetical protein